MNPLSRGAASARFEKRLQAKYEKIARAKAMSRLKVKRDRLSRKRIENVHFYRMQPQKKARRHFAAAMALIERVRRDAA